jgi:cyclohexyl-isocyanide hydratase
MTPVSIAFLLFPGVTQLDLTGPAQVLSRLGGATVDLVWKSLDPVMTDAGFAIMPTAMFEDIDRTDILCVPGGIGVTEVMMDEAAMAWVRQVGGDAQWVTSVCTGSLILGAAGLLKGYKATSHWAWHDNLAVFGAEPVKARTVFDRNRVTGGGVTAGIDFAFALMREIRGETHARMIQLALEYDPAPPLDSGSPEKAGEAMVAAFAERMAALAPNRAAEMKEAAAHLGFS